MQPLNKLCVITALALAVWVTAPFAGDVFATAPARNGEILLLNMDMTGTPGCTRTMMAVMHIDGKENKYGCWRNTSPGWIEVQWFQGNDLAPYSYRASDFKPTEEAKQKYGVK